MNDEPCYTCTPHPPSSSLYNKKIGFKEKVVSSISHEWYLDEWYLADMYVVGEM
jgi:hypothetical protein